jgi:hypothetical protein
MLSIQDIHTQMTQCGPKEIFLATVLQKRTFQRGRCHLTKTITIIYEKP